jgi:transcriptional/translational regulatory protein YebC/TACO1
VRADIERTLLAPRGLNVMAASLELVAKTQVQVTRESAPPVLKLLDALEEHDDVTHVSSNADIAVDVLEALA